MNRGDLLSQHDVGADVFFRLRIDAFENDRDIPRHAIEIVIAREMVFLRYGVQLRRDLGIGLVGRLRRRVAENRFDFLLRGEILLDQQPR